MLQPTSPLRGRAERGFSFIEILVVMGIIAVLTSLVVALVPMMRRQQQITQSQANVRNLISLMMARRTSRPNAGWPPYNGKNFVLSVVATNQLDARNRNNLEILFSPSDVLYRLDAVDPSRWKAVTRKALAHGVDHHDLTSYGGRLNAEREHLITPDQESYGTVIMCDDDDGPLHHPGGLIVGYTNGGARFLEWDDLDMAPPADADDPEPFLGDAATHVELAKLWGH